MTHPSTVADTLDAAADLLSKPEVWTQGCFARGAQQQPIGPHSPYAICFCLRGALVRVGAVDPRADTSPATRALGFATAEQMVRWNDAPDRTHGQVVARLHSAIANARGEVQP